MKNLDKYKKGDTLLLTKSFYDWLSRIDYTLLYFNQVNENSYVLSRNNVNNIPSHIEFSVGSTRFKIPSKDLKMIEDRFVLDRIEAADYRFISNAKETVEVIFIAPVT